MKIYKCDNKECNSQVTKVDKWITIGSKNENGLLIENNLQERNTISLTNYSNIHFCSKKCLVDYLFV